MEVFRLANKKYPIELSGVGASITGARWNSKGIEVVYTAQSRALAMAEVVVHVTLATLPSGYAMMTIFIPDDLYIQEIDVKKLPLGWNSFPELIDTQKIGNEFIRNKKSAVIKVPSAVVKGDFNYLLNPFHEDFDRIKIIHQEDFPFDKRIFK
ncbi:RES superfamily protein [Flavobacterium sp. 316]|uniref:RES family NAD+ phosphorylase n=1 Tax=Flavobacterium sediminilitoris TaxID=2024526 RepID=A0ABY4HNG9_9FLAO|nr:MULTISPECIES: RES family NAD+ phosphorylase [Flavobacterium]KIX21381.1 RES superfamily protein [Flavobacterium sp. 316]UOX34118.1 RES family NAD+ phosphorylase [Flavobacterium sediminilitoris]